MASDKWEEAMKTQWSSPSTTPGIKRKWSKFGKQRENVEKLLKQKRGF